MHLLGFPIFFPEVCLMKKLACCVGLVLTLTTSNAINPHTAAKAATILVDDFESYASEAAFDTAWAPIQPAQQATVPLTLSTTVAHGGSQSMRIDYNTGASPYYGQPAHFFPTQNWTVGTAVTFWYLGQTTNSSENFHFRFYNSFGIEIGRKEYPAATGQTKVGTWTKGVLDLTSYTPGPAVGQQYDVAQIRFNIGAGSYGRGIMWIDDIRVVPEPTSFGLFGVGIATCLVGRRRRLSC
jgi:hypothetical protein